MAGTTFEKYGGFATVSRVVMTFYEHVLEDDEVGHYFDDIDMARLMDHQTKFVASLMGGPMAMSDDRLAAVHKHLMITDREFDVIAQLLGRAMQEHGMEGGDIADMTRQIEGKRGLIVGKAAA